MDDVAYSLSLLFAVKRDKQTVYFVSFDPEHGSRVVPYTRCIWCQRTWHAYSIVWTQGQHFCHRLGWVYPCKPIGLRCSDCFELKGYSLRTAPTDRVEARQLALIRRIHTHQAFLLWSLLRVLVTRLWILIGSDYLRVFININETWRPTSKKSWSMNANLFE